MSNKTYGAGNGRMTPQKANMRAMADGGGLKGYMSGGGVYDNLMKAQPGRETVPEWLKERETSDSGDTRDVSQLLKNLAAHKGYRKPGNRGPFIPPWKTQPGVNMPKNQFKKANT
tara:strand:+ start:472 stop:816 length:345 start_codon:yes stop_codon:yes gene_type:complete